MRKIGKVYRSAMIKASGCLNSTSTEALKILTKTKSIDLQLKFRQVLEFIGVAVKHEEDPLRDTFEKNGEDGTRKLVEN